MSQGQVISFKASTLPSDLILDTNFIVNLTFSFTNLHADHIKDCLDFSKQLYKNKSKLYVSEWSICEFCHIFYRANLMAEAMKIKGKAFLWLELYEENPHILNKYHNRLEELLGVIEEATNKTRLTENIPLIRKRAFKIMKHIDMCPTDAYIIATAELNNIKNIATINFKCFNRAAKAFPLNIYVPDHMVNPPK